MDNAFMGSLYLIWLVAGFVDFAIHRRTDLPHTSGLRESMLHGAQLVLVGSAVLAWLAFANNFTLGSFLLLATITHASLAYWDTRSADGIRRISPAEQHIHSVLDLMPWIFTAWVIAGADSETRIEYSPSPLSTWFFAVGLAVPLTLLPWIAEFLGAMQARKNARVSERPVVK